MSIVLHVLRILFDTALCVGAFWLITKPYKNQVNDLKLRVQTLENFQEEDLQSRGKLASGMTSTINSTEAMRKEVNRMNTRLALVEQKQAKFDKQY